MNYFDEIFTEDKIKKIKKKDCLYVKGIVSLDDKKNQKELDSYAYEVYLRKMKEENEESGDIND